jgi:hypothetical protein
MEDSSDEFFFDNVFNTSSDDSDHDSEVMMAVALLILEHEEDQIQRYKGSMPGDSAALDRNRDREASNEQLYGDYFYHIIPLFKVCPFPATLSDVKKSFLAYPARSAGVRRLLPLKVCRM